MEDTRNRKYQDNGCSVIVEVPPGYQSDETDVNRGSSDDMTGRVTDQQALVHREEIPDDRSSAFDNAKLFGSTNTGLSQSDLSICSQGSVNPSYRYGNQLEYEAGHFGYPMYGAGSVEQQTIVQDSSNTAGRKHDSGSKWVEFDKSPDTEKTLLEDSKTPSIEKNDVRGGGSGGGGGCEKVPNNVGHCNNKESSQDSGSSLEQQDSSELSNSCDTVTVRSATNVQMNGKPELADEKIIDIGDNDTTTTITATLTTTTTKPVITGAILKDEASLQEDTFQEQQRKLGNGTLTPEHHPPDENTDKNFRSELNNKEQSSNAITRPESSAFAPSHKRTGSIPPRLIEESLEIERKKTLDIYSQIKTSTKNILPGLSSKFELLQNEVSPVDEKES